MFPTGTYTKPNGETYEGPYDNDIATGIHKVTYADGTTGLAKPEKDSHTSWEWIKI
jgi:hypothetical protein